MAKNKLTLETRQKVYNYWKQHIVISVDRRNDRQTIRKCKRKLNPLSRDLEDSNIKMVSTNRGKKLEAHRYIYTKPVRKLHTAFILEHEYVSLGTFLGIKPFYVSQPTEREKKVVCA